MTICQLGEIVSKTPVSSTEKDTSWAATTVLMRFLGGGRRAFLLFLFVFLLEITTKSNKSFLQGFCENSIHAQMRVNVRSYLK